MPITNVLLVRAAYGWDEVTRPSSVTTYGRREALYGLGANASPADVVRTADARLDIIATPRYQYDAEHQPFSLTELAYRGYGVGDTLPMTVDAGSVTERVISLAVSEDDVSGQSTVTASLHDVVMYASPLENFVAMLSQAVKKMIPGTGRGDWKEAQPVTPPAVPAPVSAWVPPAPSAGWTELTAPPTPFENGAPGYAVALGDGTILVGAGWGSGPGTSECKFWIYDPATDSYAPTADGPSGATYALLNAGAFASGKAYAVSDTSSGIVRFDSGSWTTRAANPSPFGGGSSCSDETSLFVIDGGMFQSYDPSGNSWSTLNYPPYGGDYDAMVCDGTHIWLFADGSPGRTTKYTIGSDTWDSGLVLAVEPTPRSFAGSGLIDGAAYEAGGFDVAFAATDVLEIYDLAGDSWTTGPAMSSALATAAAAVVDGKLYVFGVEGSPSFAAKARVYAP